MDVIKNKYFEFFCFVLSLSALFIIFRYLGGLLLPFIIGFVFAMLIRNFVRFIEKATGMNSKISAGICTAICYILIFALVFFAVRALIGEIIRFFDNLPEIYEINISPIIKRAEKYFSDMSGRNSEFEKMVASILGNAENELVNFVKTLSGNAAEKLANLLLKIPDLFVTITVTIVASFFISMDFDTINNFFLSQFGKNTKQRFVKLKEVLFDAAGKVCLSYLLIFLITFAELTAGLFLLRVKYALVISMVIAIADIFPIIGTGTILIPWAVIELTNGDRPLALGLFVLFLIISVVRNIIEPKIIGKNSGIHPIATMIAMYLGLKIGGVIYAIAFPFFLIIIKELNAKGFMRLYYR